MLHRRRRTLRTGLAAVLMVLGALFGAVGLSLAPLGAALAQTAATPAAAGNDAFTVSGVPVDVSSSNANTARDQAITQAQRKAWETLYQRMVPGGGATPKLSDTELSRLVQGFEIEDEKASPTRYVATYAVRFRPQAVRDALGGAGAVAYSEPPTKPFVLLPVTTIAGRSILWEDRTAWREAWEARGQGSSFVQLVVPDGELDDIAAIGVSEALSGDSAALGKIAQRYKAGGVIIARTDLAASGPDTKAGLTVDVMRYTPDGGRDQQTVTVKPDGSDRPADLLARAVTFTAAAIDESWRRDNAAPSGPEQSIAVSVPLSALGDWIAARKRLSGVSAISHVEVTSLSRVSAEVVLTYRGDVEKLRQALAGRELSLVEAPPRPPVMAAPGQPPSVPGPVWELRLSAGSAAAAGGLPLGGTPAGLPPRNLGTLPAAPGAAGGL